MEPEFFKTWSEKNHLFWASQSSQGQARARLTVTQEKDEGIGVPLGDFSPTQTDVPRTQLCFIINRKINCMVLGWVFQHSSLVFGCNFQASSRSWNHILQSKFTAFTTHELGQKSWPSSTAQLKSNKLTSGHWPWAVSQAKQDTAWSTTKNRNICIKNKHLFMSNNEDLLIITGAHKCKHICKESCPQPLIRNKRRKRTRARQLFNTNSQAIKPPSVHENMCLPGGRWSCSLSTRGRGKEKGNTVLLVETQLGVCRASKSLS